MPVDDRAGDCSGCVDVTGVERGDAGPWDDDRCPEEGERSDTRERLCGGGDTPGDDERDARERPRSTEGIEDDFDDADEVAFMRSLRLPRIDEVSRAPSTTVSGSSEELRGFVSVSESSSIE